MSSSVEFYRNCWLRTVRIAIAQAERAKRYRLAWLSARKRAQNWEEQYWMAEQELAAERYTNQGKVAFVYKTWWDAVPDDLKEEVKRRERERHPIMHLRLNKETGKYERVEPPFVVQELPLEN